MIVCLCRGISERQVRTVVAEGARSTDAIAASCGAGTDCGACMLWLSDYLVESDAAVVIGGGGS